MLIWKNKILVLWGDGSAKREIIFVDDIANACIYFMNKKTKETFTKVLPMDKRNEPCRDPNVEKVISVPKMITISDLGGKEDKLREDISQKADAGLKAKGKDRNGAKKNRGI